MTDQNSSDHWDLLASSLNSEFHKEEPADEPKPTVEQPKPAVKETGTSEPTLEKTSTTEPPATDRTEPSRRRRRSKKKKWPAKKVEEVARVEKPKSKDSSDEPTPDQKAAKAGHRSIPTWEEAVGMIVETNLQSRAKQPGGGASRGRGKGRGSNKGGRR